MRWTAALLLTMLACGEPRGERPELLSVPHPPLEEAETAVREQVAARHAALEALLAEPTLEAPAAAEAFGELGLVYLAYVYLDAAGACFENAERLAPGDGRWPALRGTLLQMQGRLEEASASLARARELRPGDVPTLLRLGQVKLELGLAGAARELFEGALELAPESAAAWEGLGRLAVERGDAAAAAGAFEQALALQPSASGLHYALAQSYFRLGEHEKAEHHLARRGETPVRIADPLTDPVATLGRTAQFYLTQAAQAEADGRFDAAAAAYREALDLEAHSWPAHIGLATSLQRLGDLAGAVSQLGAALAAAEEQGAEVSEAERAELERLLGGLLLLAGRGGEAVERLAAALEREPASTEGRLLLADALVRDGRVAEALEHYDRLIAATGGTGAPLFARRAAARELAGRSAEAVADLRRAVELAPGDAALRLRLAERLEAAGDTAGAEAERLEAERLAGDGAERLALLVEEGRARVRAGEHAAALESFGGALELDPEATAARYERAAVLAHLGRYDEALPELERVIAAHPRHLDARRARVAALLLLGRWTAARDELRAALQVYPREHALANALARLLATAPEAAARNGELALELARRAHESRPGVATAETLAAAQAEAGDPARAAEVQGTLVSAAERAGNAEAAGRLRQRLSRYQQGEPWRAASAEEILTLLR